MEILILFFSVIIIVIAISILNHRLKNKESHNRKRIQRDDTNTVNADDDFEDVLLTGLILGDMLDDDAQDEADLGGDDSGDYDGFE